MSKRSFGMIVMALCLMAVGSQALATGASWVDNFDTGYTASRELVKSPWVQQTNDAHLINPLMTDLDLRVSSGDWWMNAYSGAWCVGQYGYHWGLVSRPTGAVGTETNVVAQFVNFNQVDSAAVLALSSQAGHNGQHWMNVPGSVVLNIDYYTQTATVYGVNSAGVATSKVISNSIGGWQWWRLVAPKAYGAQTVSVEKSASKSGPFTQVTTIDVDSSFKADHLGFGLYSAGFVDDISWNIDYTPRPKTISYSDSIIVDGNLSDWSPSDFVPLDQALTTIDPSYAISYTGWPSDGAYYAAKVGDNGNKVYVAVKINDPTHYFNNEFGGGKVPGTPPLLYDPSSWTWQDDVEIYIHPFDASGPVNYSSRQEAAQQFSIGIKDSDHNSSWAVMGGHTDVPASAGLTRAVKVDGNWLYYEVAMTPWKYFDGITSPGVPNTAPNNVRTALWNGDLLGVDVTAYDHLLGSMWDDWAGMVGENLVAGKSGNYNSIAYHVVTGIPAPPIMSIADARNAPDGSRLEITSGVVSEVFTDFFYVETTNRSSGIRVYKAGHGLTKNQIVTSVTGQIMTNADTGERYVLATQATASGAYVIEPLGSSNRGLAGGGLPTTGLLVKAWGKPTDLGGGMLRLNDGSGLDLRCQIVSGGPGSTRQWTDGFEMGYTASRELVKSPWVQQINDGHLIDPAMVDLDLHVSSGDWWMNAYSGAWCVGQYGYHWGLVSRPTGAASTDTNVVAKFVSFNQSDSAQLLVLSPQADHNGRQWMTVPGSVGLKVDFYNQRITAFSVNSAGVATSKEISTSISGWQQWRLVAPKASGAQTVSVEGYTAGAWSAVTTIGVDASFNARHLGLGMYSCGFVDDISYSSTVGSFDSDKTCSATGPMSLYKDPSTGKVVNLILVKDALTGVSEF